MPTASWQPNGQETPQVWTFTGTGAAINGVWSLTQNGKTIAYTLATATIATEIVSFLAVLQAAQQLIPEFGEVVFASPTSTTITVTANNPGTPFVLANGSGMTKGQSGGATATFTQTVANSSPSDAASSSNWYRSVGVGYQLPQNGDDMVIANSDVPILWNIDQLAGVLLNSYTRYQSFTGSIGLPENNPAGYVEWRPTYLQLGSNINPAIAGFQLIAGVGAGDGPTRERYDTHSYRTDYCLLGAGSPADAYQFRILGSHGLNTVTINGVTAGCCMLPTEVTPNGATINTATVDGGGTLDCGVGCAFSGTSGGGTLTLTGASSTLFNTPSVVARNNSTLTLSAVNGTYASVSAINGVQLTLTQPMTISVLVLQKSSNLDASQVVKPSCVTIPTLTMDADTCVISDPNNALAPSNGWTFAGEVSSGPYQFTGPRAAKYT
jgi:hypothetical protein